MRSGLIETEETNWYFYKIKDSIYLGAGDTTKLPILERRFDPFGKQRIRF
ncbi:hypothetical protein LEP1GSC168_0881 [Leptospira santarosai str. HAI134]|nr:hypothetical protein LEP1GSC168_0881 [Leptospira santarosai str. HAI134]